MDMPACPLGSLLAEINEKREDKGMKKKSPKLVAALVAVLTLANVFSLTGCGKTENTGSQTNQEVQF